MELEAVTGDSCDEDDVAGDEEDAPADEDDGVRDDDVEMLPVRGAPVLLKLLPVTHGRG